MTSPIFRPQAPVPATWAPAGGWYAAGAASSSNSAEVSKWDQELAAILKQIKDLPEAINAANAESIRQQREALTLQYEDAQKGRDNAIELQRMRDEASRYGYDAQRQTAIQQLEEDARQFNANHALEQQKYGLNVADSYTRYAQTYDDIWALQDFKGALGRVGQGLAPEPISASATQPRAKTWDDFAALARYAPQGGGTGAMPGGASGVADAGISTQPSGGSGGGADLRLKAMRAVADAIPPSDTPGIGNDGWAAINAFKSLYFAGRPGDVERLGKERTKIGVAGLARAGYNPALLEEDRQRSLPGQRNVRAY